MCACMCVTVPVGVMHVDVCIHVSAVLAEGTTCMFSLPSPAPPLIPHVRGSKQGALKERG